ncbi:MAG: hypothetical protein LBV10_14095 [Stenotrophomonas sp.]|uniref:hypothetical protein n=1 Tax=Stenotrophomonas sp. TaxID=69392 RepID=UPI0028420D2A|nr:hypothetical protein [Stenotrophomonas sp.]MDR2960667.1 hypothetical protein [Stenotrophomonas sp.]
MALRTPLAGLLLALAVGHAAAADLPWSLPADASPVQTDAALRTLGTELLESASLTNAQRSHALLALGRATEARPLIRAAGNAGRMIAPGMARRQPCRRPPSRNAPCNTLL